MSAFFFKITRRPHSHRHGCKITIKHWHASEASPLYRITSQAYDKHTSRVVEGESSEKALQQFYIVCVSLTESCHSFPEGRTQRRVGRLEPSMNQHSFTDVGMGQVLRRRHLRCVCINGPVRRLMKIVVDKLYYGGRGLSCYSDES